jgi:hypothetical protein
MMGGAWVDDTWVDDTSRLYRPQRLHFAAIPVTQTFADVLVERRFAPILNGR